MIIPSILGYTNTNSVKVISFFVTEKNIGSAREKITRLAVLDVLAEMDEIIGDIRRHEQFLQSIAFLHSKSLCSLLV